MMKTSSPPKMDLWLPEAGEFFRPPPPDQGFDPEGAWEQTYVILDNAPDRHIRKMRAEGFLRIRRSAPGRGGRFVLDVELAAQKQRFGSLETKIEMECLPDRLSTPVAWKVGTVSLDAEGKPVEVTRIEESGRVENGTIVRKGRRVHKLAAPPAWTSNWSLFDAVQRLGGREIEPIRFDMLEDLDLVKPNQRLSYWGTAEVELGGKTIRLAGYQQIGEGILPYHYWLDESNRLIFAYGGLRGFLFNPKGATPAVKPAKPAPSAKPRRRAR
jgi:hypothetical protein